MGRLIAALAVAAYTALRWYKGASVNDPQGTEHTISDIGQALDVLAAVIAFAVTLLDALTGIRQSQFRFRAKTRHFKFGQETASDDD